MADVYDEVANLMSNLHVNMHKIKECSRKYAFELPNIPKEGKYLKLMYPYDSKSTRFSTLASGLTSTHRTGLVSGLEGRHLFSCLWHEHCSL